jgi:hypothetical protein
MDEVRLGRDFPVMEARPEPREYITENYEVIIETLESGYVLRVGCKKFAIANKNILINMLTKYFTNPAEIQKQFWDKTLEIK